MARKYGKASIKAIEEQVNNAGKSWGGKSIFRDVEGEDFLKLAKGSNCIRIMPPLDDGEFYGEIVWAHYNIGMDEDSYLCLKKNYGESCPICEHQSAMKRQGADEEDVKALNPRKRYIFNAVDMNNKRAGVKIFNCPPTLAEGILKVSKNPRTKEYIDVSDAVEGYDIYVERDGEGLKTRYNGIQVDTEATPVEDDRWFEQMYDLKDLLVKPDPEDMANSLGIDSGSDEPEDRRSSRRSRSEEDEEAPRAASRSRVRDDEQESDDKDDDGIRDRLDKRLRRGRASR